MPKPRGMLQVYTRYLPMVWDWSMDFLVGNQLFFVSDVTDLAMFYLGKT